jgi:hypothetical protein
MQFTASKFDANGLLIASCYVSPKGIVITVKSNYSFTEYDVFSNRNDKKFYDIHKNSNIYDLGYLKEMYPELRDTLAKIYKSEIKRVK